MTADTLTLTDFLLARIAEDDGPHLETRTVAETPWERQP